MSKPIVEIARAMYLKEKSPLDLKVAKEIQVWASECSSRGVGTSSMLLEGIWERQEERARKLCRYFWESLMDLVIKQKGSITAEDQEYINSSERGRERGRVLFLVFNTGLVGSGDPVRAMVRDQRCDRIGRPSRS